MPSVFRLMLAVGLLTMIATATSAQTTSKSLPAPQPSVGIPSGSLLLDPSIQHEIGFTEKQRTSLALIEAEAEEARQGAMAEAGDEGFDFNSMMSGVDEMARRQRSATAKLLTPTQRTRLLQIEWQREGWLALGRADVATKLDLKPAQVQKVRSIIESMRRKQSQAVFAVPESVAKARQNTSPRPDLNPSNGFQGNTESLIPGGGPLNFSADEFQAQTSRTLESSRKLQDEAAREVDGVLSPEQKSAFERLLGRPFDFKTLNAGNPPPRPPTTSPRPRAGTSKKSVKPR